MHNNNELIEQWDWEKAEPTGKAVPRDRAHREGIAHEGVHLWVIRDSETGPEILFQHRARDKDMFPDCLDISVGGHVPFGLKKDKIQKESREEIGIAPDDHELVYLGLYRYEEIDRDFFHREFQRVYLYKDNRPLDKYRFNDGEVIGVYSVPLEKLKLLFTEEISFMVDGYDGSEIIKKKVTRKHFHPLIFADSMREYMDVFFKAVNELVNYGKAKTLFSREC